MNINKNEIKYKFDELDSNNKGNNNGNGNDARKRKLIVIEGPHDIIDSDDNEISIILVSYFKHLFKTKIFAKILDDEN